MSTAALWLLILLFTPLGLIVWFVIFGLAAAKSAKEAQSNPKAFFAPRISKGQVLMIVMLVLVLLPLSVFVFTSGAL